MPRYIESKYLVDWCNEMYQKQTKIMGKEYCNAFLQAVVVAPTADVVPKSEVEQLKRNLEQCENGYRQEMHLLQCKLTNANSEVERLEQKIQWLTISMNAYGLGMVRLKEKNYELAREIFAEIERMCIDTFGNFNHRVFAELKKKYQEGE